MNAGMILHPGREHDGPGGFVYNASIIVYSENKLEIHLSGSYGMLSVVT
jgi:hypothetical protein